MYDSMWYLRSQGPRLTSLPSSPSGPRGPRGPGRPLKGEKKERETISRLIYFLASNKIYKGLLCYMMPYSRPVQALTSNFVEDMGRKCP